MILGCVPYLVFWGETRELCNFITLLSCIIASSKFDMYRCSARFDKTDLKKTMRFGTRRTVLRSSCSKGTNACMYHRKREAGTLLLPQSCGIAKARIKGSAKKESLKAYAPFFFVAFSLFPIFLQIQWKDRQQGQGNEEPPNLHTAQYPPNTRTGVSVDVPLQLPCDAEQPSGGPVQRHHRRHRVQHRNKKKY